MEEISLPGSSRREVQILDTQSGEKSGIEPKGWSNVLWTSWAPDNQRLYVSGLFGSEFESCPVKSGRQGNGPTGRGCGPGVPHRSLPFP
jgi:hypothetical protein